MTSLVQCLSEHPRPLLEALAQMVGLSHVDRDPERAAREIAARWLEPEAARALWERLSPAARAALAEVRQARTPVLWSTFVRRYGPFREMGPARLQREQPWRTPQSPAEELYYRGWVYRRFIRQGATPVEVVYVPAELALLLPETPAKRAEARPQPTAAPAHPTHAGDAFLEDVVTLLSYIYNEGMSVDQEGRPLRGDLARVGERWLEPLEATQLLHPPPRVHLLFHHVYALGLVRQEGNRLRVQAKRLARWLQQPRAYQRLTLWRAWAESRRWNDLWYVPDLECLPGPWQNAPYRARSRFLSHLTALATGAWYTLDDVVRWLFEVDPDFQRQAGDYEAWLIRRRGESALLRGFDHWHDVEGALIRFYVTGPLFWLGAVTLDDAARPSAFALTDAGARWLRRRSEPMRAHRPPLRVTPDFRVHLPHDVHPFDRFRVSRFADWEASRPTFCYRISRHSLARAAAQGLTPSRILAFLRQVTRGQIPPNVARAVARGHARPSASSAKGGS